MVIGDRLLCKKDGYYAKWCKKDEWYIIDSIYVEVICLRHINGEEKTNFYLDANNTFYYLYTYFYTKEEHRKIFVDKLTTSTIQ